MILGLPALSAPVAEPSVDRTFAGVAAQLASGNCCFRLRASVVVRHPSLAVAIGGGGGDAPASGSIGKGIIAVALGTIAVAVPLA